MNRHDFGSQSVDNKHISGQDELHRLFEAAAAKSLAVVCSLDAEPEMAEFVEFVKRNPNLRGIVVDLVAQSFSEEFHMKWPPIDLWRFCMHDLRWPEVRGFILAKKKEDADRNGARCSGVWDDILEAFDEDWEGAQYFESFKRRLQ